MSITSALRIDTYATYHKSFASTGTLLVRPGDVLRNDRASGGTRWIDGNMH